MKWSDDLPETWEDAPAHPPEPERPGEVELADTEERRDDGALLRPAEGGIPDGVEGTRATHTLYSSATVSVSEFGSEEGVVRVD